MADELKLMAEKHETDYDLALYSSLEATSAYVTLVPKAAFKLSADDLHAWLARANVVFGIDVNAIGEICQQAELGAPSRQRLVAKGLLPEPGQDALLELTVKPFSLDPKSHTTHFFDQVVAGQKIATLWPAQKGRDGCSIKGENIPAAPVAALVVKAGSGVHADADSFVASRNGRVIFKDPVLTVAEELVVDQDVDDKVGQVDFAGFVHVRGRVRDGFNVIGHEGIRVDGGIGDCRLESDGDIEISSMSGRRTGAAIIRCGGDLTARQLNDVVVECAGNVVVKKECLHSIVKSLGAVSVPGAIIGGACIARNGIEAGCLGAEFGVKTLVIAGVDYRLLKHTLEFQELLNEVQKLSWEVLHKSGPAARRPDLGSLSQQIAKLMQMDIASSQAADSPQEKKSPPDEKASNAKVNVLKRINGGTVVFLGQTVQEVMEMRSSACSIIEYAGRELQFLEYTPLFANAAPRLPGQP